MDGEQFMSRRLMLGNSQKSEDVRFWLSGEDAPVLIGSTGYWYERVENIPFTIYGSNAYDSENQKYDFSVASWLAEYTQPNSNNYDFGHHWKLYFDIDAYVYGNRTVDKYFLDFGSVTNTNKNFGFSMGLTTNNTTTIGINWKLMGNNSNPGIGALTHPYQPSDPYTGYESVSGYYAIIDGGDGYDRLEVSINGVVQRYNVQIPQTSYSPPWNNQRIVVGSALNNSFKLPNKIRELKMVVID